MQKARSHENQQSSHAICILVVAIISTCVLQTNAAEPKITSWEEVAKVGPLKASVEQMQAFVKEIDDTERNKLFIEPGTGVENLAIDSEHEGWKNRLVSHTEFQFLGDSSLRTTTWQITRPTDRDELAYYSQLSREWSPATDKRPVIEARVISPDGTVRELKQSQVFEQAADYGNSTMYSDQRRIAAVLSGVEVGAIIEVKTVFQSRGLIDKSVGFGYSLTDASPSRITSMLISGEPEVKWTHELLGPAVVAADGQQPKRQSNGMLSLQIIDPASLYEWYESRCGPNAYSIPYVRAAVTSSWKDVGKAYAKRVEDAIAGGEVGVVALLAGVEDESKQWSRGEKIRWTIKTIHSLVRYTGMELGVNTVIPVTPDQVLGRRFGDCKDQSTLMIAMLKKLGVEAKIVLLRSSTGLDISPDLPCMDFFNHAIVAIPDETQSSGFLMIDPTAVLQGVDDYPIGYLPISDQGRRVLVCDRDDSKLVETPARDDSSGIQSHTAWMDCNQSGDGAIAVHLQIEGPTACETAILYDDENREATVQWWEDYLAKSYQTKILSCRVKPIGTQPDGTPTIECLVHSSAAQLATMRNWETTYDLSAIRFLADLNLVPEMMPTQTVQEDVSTAVSIESVLATADEPNEELAKRRNPLVCRSGTGEILRYGLRLPRGLRFPELPKPWKETIGCMEIESSFQALTVDQLPKLRTSNAKIAGRHTKAWTAYRDLEAGYSPTSVDDNDHIIIAEYKFTSRPGTMSAAEVNRGRERMKKILASGGPLDFHLVAHWGLPQRLLAKEETALDDLVQLTKTSNRRTPLTIMLAGQLFDSGLPVLGQRMVQTFDQPKGSLSSIQQLFAIRRPLLRPDCARSLRNTPVLKSIFNDGETLLSGAILAEAVRTWTNEPGGMLTTDEASFRKASQEISDLLRNPGRRILSDRDRQQLRRVLIACQLASRQDRTLEKVLKLESDVLNQTLLGVMENRRSKEIDKLERNTQKLVCEILWNQFVSLNRPDLAMQLQQLYDAEVLPGLVLKNEKLPSLGLVDRSNPESVARAVLAADLESDVEQLMEHAAHKRSVDTLVNNFRDPYSPAWQWLQPLHEFRSKHLTETVAALVDVQLDPLSPILQRATLRYSPTQATGFLLIQNVDGEWKFALNRAHTMEILVAHLDAGHRQRVAKTADVIMPELVSKLPWFGFSGWDAARIWRALPEHPKQMDWALRALASEVSMQSKFLAQMPVDSDSDSSVPEPPKAIAIWINRINQKCYRQSGEFDKQYELALSLAQDNPDQGNVIALLHCVEHLRLDEKHNGANEQEWLDVADRCIDSQTLESTVQYLLARKRIALGKPIEALDNAQAFLSNSKDQSGQLPNFVLWNSLLYDESPDKIAERLAALENLIGKDAASIHTLSCCQAVAGQLDKAIATARSETLLRAYSRFSTANELLRGLIAMQIGLDNAAAECFEATISTESVSQSAMVAKRYLKQVKENAKQ